MASVNTTLFPGYSPSWDDRMDMNSGFIPVTDDDSLFFWSFHAKNNSSSNNLSSNNSSRPLVIWLNGGPGCSSMDGALMEIGPLRVVDDTTINWNIGWFERSDLLFIDQPIGTGFSFMKSNSKSNSNSNSNNFDTSLEQSSLHLLTFLENYFNKFPDQYNNYNSLIIAGESYAGQYIPHLTNLLIDSPRFKHKLKAIMLGNAWLDPPLQSLSYIPFAIDNGIIDIKSPEQEKKVTNLMQLQQSCQNNQNTENSANQICDNILLKLLSSYRDHNKCINVYDINKIDNYPACGNNWPEILPSTTNFLNLPNVKSALNIPIELGNWKECNNDVHSHFTTDNDKTGAELLNHILNNGIKVNLFSGVNDMICNYLGSELVIKKHTIDYLNSNNLSIIHQNENENENENNINGITKRDIEKFQMDNQWYHNDKLSGSIWNRGNLSYIQIYNASHMVPYDLSETSIGLLDLTLNDDIKTHTYTRSTIPNENNEKEDKDPHSRKSIAIILLSLIFILIIWCFYKFWKNKRNSQYSALAIKRKNTYSRYAYEWMSGNKGKKKVHWIDLEGGDDAVDGDGDVDEFNIDDDDGGDEFDIDNNSDFIDTQLNELDTDDVHENNNELDDLNPIQHTDN